MALVRTVRSSFPGLETEESLAEHRHTVLDFMEKREAVCAKTNDAIIGVLLFSKEKNALCFLAVDPAYRRRHIAKQMFRFVLPLMTPGKDITVTTYREDVTEGNAARAFYLGLGFAPGRMTEEFGSPVQEFGMEASKWQIF
ncbi:MAG: GNAT family N-acetyltransferase [Eubacteriales bacterium]